MLDKLLMAALYFRKTVTFGFLIGLGLFGAVLVAAIVSAPSGGASTDASDAGSSPANQP